MAFTLSPNMSLPIPGVGTEPGPQYANDVNNSLTIVDAHTHAIGSGVQITPAAININTDLGFNGFNIINIRSVNLQPQGSPLTNPSDIGCLYESGVDLYYNDGSGNQIRITQGGSVAGATGTITGLPSGTASASYAAGVFTFQAATNTPANVDGGSFIFRNNIANSHGLTLQPPNAMGSDYSLTLPSLPPQTNVMTLDSSGNMGSVTWNNVAENRTRPIGQVVGLGGIATSPSVASFSTTSASPVAIPGFTCTLTTSGRPVTVSLIQDSTSVSSGFTLTSSDATALMKSCNLILVVNGASRISTQTFAALVATGFNNAIIPLSSLSAIDIFIAAGTPGVYTYSVFLQTNTSDTTIALNNAILVAQEL